MLKKLLYCIAFFGFTHIILAAQRPACPPAPKKAPLQAFLNVNNRPNRAKRSLAGLIEHIATIESMQNQNNIGLNIQHNNNRT